MLIVVFSMALATILVILVATFVLYFRDKNEVIVVAPKKKILKPLFECDIEELSERIATEVLAEDELLKLIDHVAKNFVFPSRNSSVPHEPYMKFVYNFCMNESARANTIVKMSNTLKTINRAYKKEIERIEKEAVRVRDQAELAEEIKN